MAVDTIAIVLQRSKAPLFILLVHHVIILEGGTRFPQGHCECLAEAFAWSSPSSLPSPTGCTGCTLFQASPMRLDYTGTHFQAGSKGPLLGKSEGWTQNQTHQASGLVQEGCPHC